MPNTTDKAKARNREYQREKRALDPAAHNAKQRAYRKANPEKFKLYGWRKRGSDPTRGQTSHCEACGRTEKTVYDHDHKTGAFRGWLCNGCNIALGHVRDSRDRLQLLIHYLHDRELLS